MQIRGLLSRKYEFQASKIIAYSVMIASASFVLVFSLLSNKPNFYSDILNCEEGNLKNSWIQLAMELKSGNVPLAKAKETAQQIFYKTPIRFDEEWLETMISDTDKIYRNDKYYDERTLEQLSDQYKKCVVSGLQRQNSISIFLRGR